ncbi:HMCN1, partial [Symbiodinium necroappetens]
VKASLGPRDGPQFHERYCPEEYIKYFRSKFLGNQVGDATVGELIAGITMDLISPPLLAAEDFAETRVDERNTRHIVELAAAEWGKATVRSLRAAWKKITNQDFHTNAHQARDDVVARMKVKVQDFDVLTDGGKVGNDKMILFTLWAPELSLGAALPPEEYDAHCQSFLLNSLPCDTCVFGDIMDILGDGKAWTRLLQSAPTYWEKKRAIYDLGNVYDTGFCARHHKHCPFDTGSKLRVGGPPCVDYSSAGLRCAENGPTVGTQIAYGLKAQSTSTELLCFENVKNCPEWLRRDNLPSFTLEHFDVATSDYGFNAMRRAVERLLSDLWYDRLTLVGDLWDHAQHFGWAMESVHSHVYFLSCGVSTTKFTLEEVLASLKDRGRESNHGIWSIYRVYNQQAYCSRFLNSRFGQGTVLKAAQQKLREYDDNQGAGALWKPSGIDADYRACAAHALLQRLADVDFAEISGAWASCLLQAGQVYLRRSNQQSFLSLGFRGHAAFGWRIERQTGDWLNVVDETTPTTLKCRSSLELLLQTKLGEPGTEQAAQEEFLFVPTSARFATNTTVVKFGEKQVGHKSRIMSLIQKFHPDWTEKQMRDRLSAILNKDVEDDIPCEDVVREALGKMDASDKAPFMDMAEKLQNRHRSELIQKRLAPEDRKEMEEATPDVVKNLRPIDIPSYAYLVFQPLTSSFAAYWPNSDPKKKPLSTSKTFGARTTATAALNHCVNWFYGQYHKNGGAAWLGSRTCESLGLRV